MPEYIKWDAPGVEVIAEGEEELKKTIANQFNELQRMHFKEHQHGMRATHIKTQGCIVGTFTIHDNLPPHLAQGMFAKPGKHDVVLRYSSLTPKLVPDTDHAPRGMSFKVFDVVGEKLHTQVNTQDFTFNNYPNIELRHMNGTHKLADSFVRNFNDLKKFGEEQAARDDVEIATAPARIPKQAQLASVPQWSQGAYRYGDYVAKFAVFPTGEEQKKQASIMIQETDPLDILSTNLQKFHAKNKATFSFNVQLLENLEEQPVEDLGPTWDEEKYPFVQVATLEFEPQESLDNAFRTWFDDSGVACNPWHGLVVHRPLGSAQRTRRVVYAESRKLRLKQNGLKDYREPVSVADVPIPAPIAVA